VTQGLAALEVSLREIGWKKPRIGDFVDHDDSGSVREFE
jgi:hypothetical protein